MTVGSNTTVGDSDSVGGTVAVGSGVGARVCGGLVGVGWKVAGTMVAVEAGDDSPPQAAMTASVARMPSRNDAALNT